MIVTRESQEGGNRVNKHSACKEEKKDATEMKKIVILRQ